MGSNIQQKKVGELFLDYCDKEQSYIELSYYEYKIPSYQRAYKWNVELSEILFRDLVQPKGEGYNFGFITLSSIVKDEEKLFEVIDGQQRITTIYIIMLVLYHRLYILEAGDNEKKRLKKFINNFPFYSEDSPTIPLLEYLHRNIMNENNNLEISEINPIYENFKKIDETLSELLQKMDKEKSIGKIVEFTKNILEQRIIVLSYQTPSLALDSFIALNMKGRPLDTYEIFSAICLKIIDSPKEMNDYKKKLNEIFNLYSSNSNLLGFQSFDHFLKSMIICMNYPQYVHDSDKMSDIHLKMPNHYIEETYKNPTSIMTFIDDLKIFLDQIISFIKTGKLGDLDTLFSKKQQVESIQCRLAEIEWLTYGWKNAKDDGKMLIIIRRFLYALVIKIEKEKSFIRKESFDLIYKCLTEITLTLYHHHLISVLGNDYQKLRSENLIISSAHQLKEFYSETFDSEKIFKSELNKDNIGISKPKFFRISLLFQLNGIEKNRAINTTGPIISEIIPYGSLNLEHFILDKNRFKTSKGKSVGKNVYLFNTVQIKKLVNDSFADIGCKSCIEKINYLNDKVFPVHRKEMQFFYFYCQELNTAIKKISDNKIDTEDTEEFLSILGDKNIDLTDSNQLSYQKNINIIMKIFLSKLVDKLEEIFVLVSNYENKSKVF
ncbi:DUF262 domain-containing protein [Enterococcus raffinosus]|uniref:DUF262 domain-containing protein n=1 Tax=Enterococcus raffinosus TaxID=71452 RepID=UPI0028FD9198|nr:hypothetical protein NUITMVRE36_00890 [Enterococcus raffinosus]